LLAAASIAAVGFAQFSASWHEMTVQHVRCAEHGELTHIASIAHHAPVPTPRRDTIESADVGAIDGHDHCGFVFALRNAAPARVVRVAVRFAPPPAVVEQPAAPVPSTGRAFVLASAPKTSPPSA
jgi:hypothetical protein